MKIKKNLKIRENQLKKERKIERQLSLLIKKHRKELFEYMRDRKACVIKRSNNCGYSTDGDPNYHIEYVENDKLKFEELYADKYRHQDYQLTSEDFCKLKYKYDDLEETLERFLKDRGILEVIDQGYL